MRIRFRDRRDAGQMLAKLLTKYANRSDVLVLALPRGGVPVGFEVAQALNAPLDVFLVRKLGVPGHEELAMGAIASGGVRVVNATVVQSLHLSTAVIEAAVAREQRELRRRETVYRAGRPMPQVRERTVILVDDGIATGATMRAAVEALREMQAARIVIATPTVAWSTADERQKAGDEFFAVMTPSDLEVESVWSTSLAGVIG